MAQTNESQEQVTVNVETLQPVTRTLMTIGALPTSYLISMTCEEQLLWLQNYLIKTVIPAINNNAEATQEVQDIVMALQDYINTQFSEMNLQEYIDNKLDEMLESGVFENILMDYVQLTKVYDTYNDMIFDASTFTNGMKLKTLGYHFINDGGGAEYFVTNVQNTNKYQISIGTNLWIELIIKDNTLHIKQIGAYGDDANDDTQVFKNAINFLNGKYLTLYIDSGKYLISEKLEVKWLTDNYWNNKVNKSYCIKGAGSLNSVLKFSTSDGLYINPDTNILSIKLEDFAIWNSEYNPINTTGGERVPDLTKGIGLLVNSIGYTGSVRNIIVKGFYIGISSQHNYCGPIFDNCFTNQCVFGFSSKFDTGISINSCNFWGLETCICQQGGKAVYINCVCEDSFSRFYPSNPNDIRSKFEGRGIYTTGVSTFINTHCERLWGNALYARGDFFIHSLNSNLCNGMYYEKDNSTDLASILSNLNHNYDDFKIDVTSAKSSANIDGTNLQIDTHASINCDTSSEWNNKVLPNIKFNNVPIYQGVDATYNRFYMGNRKPIVSLSNGVSDGFQNFDLIAKKQLIGGLFATAMGNPTQFNGYDYHYLLRKGRFTINDGAYDLLGLRISINLDGEIMIEHAKANSSNMNFSTKTAIKIAADGKVTFPQN